MRVRVSNHYFFNSSHLIHSSSTTPTHCLRHAEICTTPSQNTHTHSPTNTHTPPPTPHTAHQPPPPNNPTPTPHPPPTPTHPPTHTHTHTHTHFLFLTSAMRAAPTPMSGETAMMTRVSFQPLTKPMRKPHTKVVKRWMN